MSYDSDLKERKSLGKMRIQMLLLCELLLCSAAARSDEESNSDKLALMDFKKRVTQDPFGVMALWNDSTGYCNWAGITCNSSNRRVMIIDRQSLRLSGSLPPSIGNMSFLTGINLQNNTFGGEIPQEIGRLLRLRHINMTQNQISGPIPTNVSQCRALEVLNVGLNSLSGPIPDEISSLSSLKVLGVGSNNLTGPIPTWIGNLSSLVIVSLALNRFTGSIPNEFGKLSKLGFFQLYGNQFTGVVPPSVYNLSTLWFFSVTQNQLHGEIPSDIGIRLPNLQIVAGGVNSFTGSIPVSLSNCTNLRVLDFAENGLTGGMPPTSFGVLKSLEWLNFDDNRLGAGDHQDVGFVNSLVNCTVLEKLSFNRNRLGGELPVAVSNLSAHLRILGFSENLLRGTIPSGIKGLVSLANLRLEGNLITGPIPNSFGELKNLSEVRLHGNGLSGPIPPSIENLTSLTKLYLQDNKLQGSIPAAIGSCQKLVVLNLSSNNLEGVIPKEVGGISSLSVSLSLSNNSLSGQIPAEVSSLGNLLELDLADNKLSGEIPSALSGCVTLQRLLLEGNSFHGKIPENLDMLKGLTYVDISRNNLSGKIPEFFSSLKTLNLSYNDFHGEVQRSGVFSNASAFSVLGNSRLCGGVPELGLPPCRSSPRSPLTPTRVILLSVAVALIVILLCALVTCCLIKRRKPPLEVLLSSSDLRQGISYMELAKATNGFSEENLIGAGSFGSVYKGLLPENEVTIAVKVLNLEQKGASHSFVKECTALKNVRHRNLLKIITLCSSIDQRGNDFKGLVFEYMSNGNLDQWLHPQVVEGGRAKKLSLTERLDIAIDVACAMEYLHYACQPPIVHCDLKPSNILIDNEMTACVGDFGLAHLIMEADDEPTSATLTAGLKGSIGYIPPEYGMGGEVSTVGDVYSYGILLLEMFTGKRPTDEMFRDGLSIDSFVAGALPHHVMTVVDSSLNGIEGEDNVMDEERSQGRMEERAIVPTGSSSSSSTARSKMNRLTPQECVIAVLNIGLACSKQMPKERMSMHDVEKKMRGIREAYAGRRK
uniref:non-specific serine/threonine protein kinase n=1 Tax=Kalanchoe fedtschenkoi TaxID=63787 RepID=A0A7N0VH03_KALFE